MPRIRDLGISVIPATMLPPEIGDGAYHADPNKPGPCKATPPPGPPPQCRQTPHDDDDHQCCPTDAGSSAKDREGDDFAPEVKQELMQQLRTQLDAQP